MVNDNVGLTINDRARDEHVWCDEFQTLEPRLLNTCRVRRRIRFRSGLWANRDIARAQALSY